MNTTTNVPSGSQPMPDGRSSSPEYTVMRSPSGVTRKMARSMEVGVPQRTVVPPRALAEIDTVHQQLPVAHASNLGGPP